MKSDIVKVTNAGEGMEEALQAASASAVYRGLEKKDAIRLRLLAEEMLGMLRQITGETEASFWVESEEKYFQLHLTAHPLITGKMRKELLSVASSGKNAAAVGVMGKLRDLFERALDPAEVGDLSDFSSIYMQGMIYAADADSIDPMAFSVNAALSARAMNWSMQKMKAAVEQEKGENESASEAWDELEKSIVANLADEVKIAIAGKEVEMVVYKTF